MSKVILGGGLGGLSAAYYILEKNPNQIVTLLEASNRLGGWIKSTRQNNGVIFEQGPRTIRPRGGPQAENTLKLVEDLGLTDKIHPILSNHPAARNRLIYAKNNLNLLPNSFASLFQTKPPFQKPLISYLLNDFRAKSLKLNDDTIYNFVERRFGTDFADYLISPLICGICAGNAKEISVKFLMEKLFDYEQTYGSIGRGYLKNFWQTRKPINSALLERVKSEKWSIYSFKEGCETLPLALADNITKKGVTVTLNSQVIGIDFKTNGICLHLNDGTTVGAEHLISTLNAKTLGKLINNHPQLTELLNKIKFVDVAVVNLSYKGNNLIKNPAFGFLVPPIENVPILGVIYDSVCFPRGDNTILTVMLGGYWFDKYFSDEPKERIVLKTAIKWLSKILSIDERPDLVKVNILNNCIPQYLVGHNENVEKIQNYIRLNNLPLSLCGSSYYGVGINDVILLSKKIADEIN